MMSFLNRAIPFFCTLLFLSACGGGGSSETKITPNTPPIATNKAPTIGAGNVEVESNINLSLSAQATDSDGTITSYLWTQKSGETVTVSSNDEEVLSFITPAVSTEQTLIFDLTVTDNDGVSTTKEILILVTPTSISFSVSGKVISANTVFSDVPVTLSVGGNSFSTKTNELGNYTIEVDGIASSDYDKIVRIIATGDTPDSIVKFVSYVDELATLVTLASKHGGILSPSEHSRLIISNISTAVAALVEQSNNGSTVQSIAVHDQALKAINPEVVLNYAAMLEYLIEAIDGDYQYLPESLKEQSFSNIYDLFTDSQLASKLYYEIGHNRLDIDNFHLELTSNETLISEFSTFTDQPQEKRLLTKLGEIVLNTDQSGQIINGSLGNRDITWQVNDNVTELTLSTPFTDPSYASIQYTQEYGQVQVSRELESYSLYNFYNSEELNLVIIKPNYSYKRTVSEEPVTVDINHTLLPYTAFNFSNKLSLTDKIIVGQKYALSLSHPKPPTFIDYTGTDFESQITAMTLDFTSSSEVYITMDSTNDLAEFSETTQKASWSASADGVIDISNEQWSIEIIGLLYNNDVNTEVFVNAAFTQNAAVYQSNQLTYIDVMPAEQHQWNEDNVAGIYQYDDELTLLSPLETYWYELNEDGSVTYFSINNSYGDFPNIDSRDILESPGLWRLIDGELVIRRFRYNGAVASKYGTCDSSEWETTLTSECIMYMERSWKVATKYTDKGQDHELIRQRASFNYAFLADSYGEDMSASGTYIASMQSIFSDFVKLNERPVTLPDDYVFIKNQAKVTVPVPFSLNELYNEATDKLN